MTIFGGIFSLAFALSSSSSSRSSSSQYKNSADQIDLIPQPSTWQKSSTLRKPLHSTLSSSTAVSNREDRLPYLSPQSIISSFVDNQQDSISRLCTFFDATPKNILRLGTNSHGVRGVRLSKSIDKNDVILSIPLKSCLVCDEEPPEWFNEVSDKAMNNPNFWATKLAASLIDIQLKKSMYLFKEGDHVDRNGMSQSAIDTGKCLWLSMLPDNKLLRSSLPIHWSEETIMIARSNDLELAVNSARLERAEAVKELMSSLKKFLKDTQLDDDELSSMCHDALDIVKTRAHHVERDDGAQWGSQFRVLAPVFDLINHGPAYSGSPSLNRLNGYANAYFQLEDGDQRLVVRAKDDLKENDEILIDYGESTHPGVKCLVSYGFVPQYSGGEEEPSTDHVAEVFLDGRKYEVGPSHLPFDMVESVATSQIHDECDLNRFEDINECLDSIPMEEEYQQLGVSDEIDDDKVQMSVEESGVFFPCVLHPEGLLNAAVAMKISERLSDVAHQLLLDPRDLTIDVDDTDLTPEERHSVSLATSLRLLQYRVLLSCAINLREWAST